MLKPNFRNLIALAAFAGAATVAGASGSRSPTIGANHACTMPESIHTGISSAIEVEADVYGKREYALTFTRAGSVVEISGDDLRHRHVKSDSEIRLVIGGFGEPGEFNDFSNVESMDVFESRVMVNPIVRLYILRDKNGEKVRSFASINALRSECLFLDVAQR